MDFIFITSIIPYFLNKNNFWINKHLSKIIEVRKTNSFWQDNTLFFKKGETINLFRFLREIDELGYEKVFRVEQPGEFAQRGGIVDIFPINFNCAIRIEFLGNIIENIEKIPIEIKDEKKSKESLKKKLKSQKFLSGIKNIKPGDYLVHLDHGIGIFTQKEVFKNNVYYVLEYAKKDKLYVPVELERKLSRYVGFHDPKISRLESPAWQKTKRKAKEDAEKIAKELLSVYSEKEKVTRSPYFIDREIENKIKDSFPYQETPDQIQVLEEIKQDMGKEKPLDRIVCGDVGFGKTEIALRIAIIAAVNNRQTAIICPTTILANQHFQNFKKRLLDLPINVSLLSRLQKKKEQDKIIKKTARGNIDIIIGTHRLLSSDIKFKNLQLLIIDDEQKFGVQQKEKLRKKKSKIDVLSLSATPIPRTLYFALSSLKNISIMQTPPLGRLPIKTYVLPFDKQIIKKAINFELKRKGQVYFLHNRVKTITDVKKQLKKLVPKSEIGIIHGRIKEDKILEVMSDFQQEKKNILVATTIIENGLDLPRVNTLIVKDSTLLGLSQAYQLRGRVGRSYTSSFAYFLYPNKKLSDLSKRRLSALKKSKLGSGYQIALKDLEIRGAGNILGKDQSGAVNQVGLNLYCQMIAENVEKIKPC